MYTKTLNLDTFFGNRFAKQIIYVEENLPNVLLEERHDHTQDRTLMEVFLGDTEFKESEWDFFDD